MNPPTDPSAMDVERWPAAAAPELPARKSRRSLFEIISIVAGLFLVLVIVGGVAIPLFCSIGNLGARTKALSSARSIALVLRLCADDNDGIYPGGANASGEPILTSNDAFAKLFPTYTQSETIFGNKLSKYQTQTPDNVIDNPYVTNHPQTLKPGENVYAYVAGLKTKSPASWPLLVDGTDGTGHYVTDKTARGGVWEGDRAVVIRLDNSGALERLRGPGNARYVPRSSGDPEHNLLDVASYMGPQAKLLDPAIKP